MTALVARDPAVDVWPLTRPRYDLLVEAGELEDQPVELLEGTLVWMVSQGEPHASQVERPNDELVIRLREAFGDLLG